MGFWGRKRALPNMVRRGKIHMDIEMGPGNPFLKGVESGLEETLFQWASESSTHPPLPQEIEHIYLAKVDPEKEDEWMADRGILYVNMIGIEDFPMIEETPPSSENLPLVVHPKGEIVLPSERELSLSLSRESSPKNSLLAFHSLIQEMETKMRKMERDSLLRFGGLDTRMQKGFDSHSASFESKISDICLKMEQSVFGKVQKTFG